jgi:hypothetical protein
MRCGLKQPFVTHLTLEVEYNTGRDSHVVAFADSLETIVNPVGLGEANCEDLVEFEVHAATDHRGETVKRARSQPR